MLYNPQLKNFIVIADLGSFNKAAQYLNITATALTKQIKILEDDLNVKLFERSFRGLILTEAGQTLYEEAKNIIQICNYAEEKARYACSSQNMHIKMGTSIMSPAQFLIEGNIWKQMRKLEPNIEIEFLPFENTPENSRGMFRNLGKQLDVITGVYDDFLLEQRGCASTFLSWEVFCIACTPNHPLASKSVIQISDLYGYEIYMMKRNWSKSMDNLRDELEKNHPQIQIHNIDFYNAQIFNTCEKSNSLLLTIEKWKNVNPFLLTIPVNWNYGINYGILHSKTPSKGVQRLLYILNQVTKSNSNK